MRPTIRNTLYALGGLFLLLAAGVAGFFLTLPEVAFLKTENPATTAMIEYRKAAAAAEGKTLPIRWKWVPLAKVPEALRRTIIIAEDGAFWVHEGVDWQELEIAIREKLEEGKPLRGASTITQQTAKNLFFSPERSLWRKAREFFVARRLENTLSKQRILELYVNIIELGAGIFGVGSAAEVYFGKSVSELTRGEMIRLAAIIPDPLDLNPTRPDRNLKWRCRVILRRLLRHQWISEEAYQTAREELQQFFGEDIVHNRSDTR